MVPHDIPVSTELIAQVQSPQEVSIVARVSGFLEKQLYIEGTMVDEGQVLFQMDRKPFIVQLESSQAALDRANAEHNTAVINLKRVRPLVEQHALSQKDLDNAIGQEESTAAAVAQAQAGVDLAKLNLSYTTIISPLHGKVAAAQQKEGAYLSPQNNQLTTVSSFDPMWVNFSMSENDFSRYRSQIAQGLLVPPLDGNYQVELLRDDDSPMAQTGRITFVNPSYNAQTGTFLIRATIANPEETLRANQYVRVRLHGAIRPHAITIPQRAVQQGSQGQFVWVLNEADKVERRPVVVGKWHGDDWFIQQGLVAGDRVVVDGALRLTSGSSVKVNDDASRSELQKPLPVKNSLSVRQSDDSFVAMTAAAYQISQISPSIL
ncbi:MAG: efflux RND transporter periplasmic adaptor subunit [Zetaproteobacteria bacterium]|nr:efflux RND transporter periplasmic adaptor subunit [Zetaproteobacteria bacterium]